MKFKLRVKLTYADYWRMNRRILQKLLPWLYAFGTLYALFEAWNSQYDWLQTLFLVVFLAVLVSVGLFAYYRFKVRRSFASNRGLQYEQIFEFENQVLRVTSEISQSQLTPDLLHKITYFDDAVYLFFSKRQVMILTKSGLENGSWSDFTDYLKENFDPKLRKNKKELKL